eukprot:CAMPEP_0198220844 /NCGR_PEP_ID=MMETSP1445-20131203/80952_1 /TAXON_ID=36898 /ORGANISM="Pyramimonas sp., Strain CCMP2087" /LENGTH=376 /DNA_ID=CAMNT_0043898757 /DNA_START=57 /DNA_END=1184 /DNA_ORIENTATION=-
MAPCVSLHSVQSSVTSRSLLPRVLVRSVPSRPRYKDVRVLCRGAGPRTSRTTAELPESTSQFPGFTVQLSEYTVKLPEFTAQLPAELEPYLMKAHFPGPAREARKSFLTNVERGEATLDLALNALHIAAEDDSIVTHSPVELPVDVFIKRIDAFANEISTHYLPKIGPEPSPEDVIAVVDDYIYGYKGIETAGRDNELLPGDILEHPGVWEDARDSYLNCVLTRKRGSPAAVAILYAEVMRKLLINDKVNFAVRMQLSTSPSEPPIAQVLPFKRKDVVIEEGGPGIEVVTLNTCTSEALVQVLRHLKRAYWPFQWDMSKDDPSHGVHGSGGGFMGAIETAMGAKADAFTEVINRTARHRLDRGIWTSSGAGDINRA